LTQKASALEIKTPRAFSPFLESYRYKAIYGGRGGGKSHFFAEAMIEACYMKKTRAVCIREVQNTIKDSVKQLLVDKIAALGLSHFFDVVDTEIRGANGSLIIFKGMQHYNAESIKSLEGYEIAWVEEAQTLSQKSLDLLRPTIRTPGSELWFSWNPTHEFDPVDLFFRGEHVPDSALVKQINWDDNPWFPDELRDEMENDRKADAEKAAHIWDGDYRQAPKGAYFSALLATAKTEGRISRVPHDPGLETHVSFDLGNGPNMVLWFGQWVGREVRIIDYLEGDDDATEEGWAWYARKLREKPYIYAPLILPHDARPRQRTSGKGDEQTLIDLGFKTHIVPRMDPGERVKLTQGFLPKCWIDEDKCKGGLHALRNYVSNYDEKMRIDRGPLHNWASHPADSIGHMAQAYEEPRVKKKSTGRHRPKSWMG